MSILAYNLYRVFAFDLERYEHSTAQSIYDKFILNEGDIQIEDNSIIVSLKKKRNLPLILENMVQFNDVSFSWGKKIQFQGVSYS